LGILARAFSVEWRSITVLALVSGFCLALGCGESTSGSVTSACDAYVQTLSGLSCGGPTPPASEVARVVALYEQVCENALALPGNGLTASVLDGCTSALQAAGCYGNAESTAGACEVSGSLPGGSACNSGSQCQSGSCQTGSDTATLCGTCAASIAVGQSCVGGGVCAVGTECETSSDGITATCQTLTYGAAGAACGGAANCNPGLYCDATKKCAARLAEGAPCAASEACEPPLVCGFQTAICQPLSPVGTACDSDEDCASGLGCGSNATCAPVTYAGSGQTCGNLLLCLVGDCLPTGVCPTVIPNGQPCNVDAAVQSPSTTCDTLSVCNNGTCVLEDSVVCK
jgi:hypothetical protein